MIYLLKELMFMTQFIELKALDVKQKSMRELLLTSYACLLEIEERLETAEEDYNMLQAVIEDASMSIHTAISLEVDLQSKDLLSIEDISLMEVESGISDKDWFDDMFGKKMKPKKRGRKNG